ncbi:MAG TPA: calcium-binding protein, partial [Rhizobiaceae bacterium]|nr:calcium-binding protein [Rhizobiaceae bacterium]
GVDVLSGEAGNDALHGGDDTDYLFGGEGDDLLFGDGGDDVMTGGSGNDFFVLGEGDDAIFTGAGADVIRFDYGNGRDTVFDFEIGVDRIDFTHTDMRPDVVAANAWDVPDGVFLSLGSGSILLSGVTLADIDFWTDFTYA